MPCIQIKTNAAVSEETAQALKSQLGTIITRLPEKTEDWLMVTLEDNCRMWFRGESEKPLAIVEVKVFGQAIDPEGSEKTEQYSFSLTAAAGSYPFSLWNPGV